MFYKTIIQGRLDFGTEKSFEKAARMYMYRLENYHKSSAIWKEGEIFDEEKLEMSIPRYVGQSSEKVFKNTVSLIAYCAQFALDGAVKAWLIDEGKILHYESIDPQSDKMAVQHYLEGKKLVKEEGKHEEAIEALNKAIEKYDKHAQAYERRAKVNFILQKYHDAARDYDKSLSIDDTNPHAWFGRGKVCLIKEEYKEAIENFDKALKFSVALQPLYWKARRLKSKAHFALKEFDKAAFDLKLFTKRVFTKDNDNYVWKKSGYFNYGKVLIELGEYKEALEWFDKALEAEISPDKIENKIILRFRGIAKQKAGVKEFKKDFQEAAELGDKESKVLLEALA